MRQPGKNNRQRGRGRRNGSGNVNRNTTLDSNGPNVRLRGNAFQLYEKYTALANDASAAGERISAEAYFQFADHYFRIHSAITAGAEERRGNNPRGEDASPAGVSSDGETSATAAPEVIDTDEGTADKSAESESDDAQPIANTPVN